MDSGVKSYPLKDLIRAPPFVPGDHVLILQDSSAHFGHLATVVACRDDSRTGASTLDLHVDGADVCFSAGDVAIAP